MKDWIEARDGIRLQLREWPRTAASGPRARGTILIAHGLGEHIGRHEQLALFLNERGWRVVGYDQRGHGASGGKRGALAHGDDLLVDLGLVLDTLRRHPADAGTLLVLLGHSMGGALAARFVAGALAPTAAWSRPVDGLVLSSPALAVGMSAGERMLLTLLGPILPHLALGNGVDPAQVSRDAAVVAAYRADPLVHGRITPRLARFVVDAGAAVIEAAPCWVLPTLLLYAGADGCVEPKGSASFASRAPEGVLETHCFAPLFHEIFHEPEKAAVLSVLGTWLDKLRPSLSRSSP